MSATLGVWLNELEPGTSMEMIERLDGVALESSNGWNNAGTRSLRPGRVELHPGRRERQSPDPESR